MSVINLDAHEAVAFAPNTVPGLMHVYCVRTHADLGITIYNAPPPYTWHHLTAGHMLTFQVDTFAAWVQNDGPSRIQLLFDELDLTGLAVDEVDGVSAVPALR